MARGKRNVMVVVGRRWTCGNQMIVGDDSKAWLAQSPFFFFP